jgi:hypothetical protein
VDILVDPSLVGDRRGPQPADDDRHLRRGQCLASGSGDQAAFASARSAATRPPLVILSQALMDLCERDLLRIRLMRNLAADLATKIRNTDLYP